MPRQLVEEFIPKSFTCLKQYSLKDFTADLIAGITVGLVALPLAMAFAISSGVAPQAGIYCAIFAGFIISALGGSKTQIGGPTGAFVVVITAIVAKHGIDGLFMCTLMAGIILMILGISGLGTAVKYIPRPVVIGFTNGIAVLIFSTQIKDFFGLKIAHVPGNFIGRALAIFENFHSFSIANSCLALVCLLIIIFCQRYNRKIPGSIIALTIGTLLVVIFDLPVEAIKDRFGHIPQGLPQLVIPAFRPDLVITLLSPTITIAMLGAIESLLSAVVSDRMSGDKHNPNVELFAQGVANILSPLFGGLPATGAIARTATNIRSGAKTPLAGMIHSLTLLVIILFAAPLVEKIPFAVLAAILTVVCYNMGEWHEIPNILRHSRASIIVWALTFTLTVFADLTVAVEAGMIMAALLYIRKVTSTTTIVEVTPELIKHDERHSIHLHPVPDGVAVFRIHGAFLFGSADKLELIYNQLSTLPKIVIIRLRHMHAIDTTGLHALEKLVADLRDSGRIMLVCGMRDQPARFMRKARFHDIIGKKNFCESLAVAVLRAKDLQNSNFSEN